MNRRFSSLPSGIWKENSGTRTKKLRLTFKRNCYCNWNGKSKICISFGECYLRSEKLPKFIQMNRINSNYLLHNIISIILSKVSLSTISKTLFKIAEWQWVNSLRENFMLVYRGCRRLPFWEANIKSSNWLNKPFELIYDSWWLHRMRDASSFLMHKIYTFLAN